MLGKDLTCCYGLVSINAREFCLCCSKLFFWPSSAVTMSSQEYGDGAETLVKGSVVLVKHGCAMVGS
jgi:hypothetical protein